MRLKSKDLKSLSVKKEKEASIKAFGHWILINVIQAKRSRDWIFEFRYIFLSSARGLLEFGVLEKLKRLEFVKF
jgi:hypothetical protein